MNLATATCLPDLARLKSAAAIVYADTRPTPQCRRLFCVC